MTDYNHQEVDYTDGELAIINHLTFSSRMHATHVDMVFIVFCSQGELKFEMDGSEYAISKDDVFVGYPNAIYNHFEASYDLRCRLLCLTKLLLQEMLYPNQSIWNKTLFLKKHYIFHLSEQEVVMQNCMNTVLVYNQKSNKTTFRKEIIHSLVQCIIYELCRTLSTFVQTEDNKETNQRKILFDRFISYWLPVTSKRNHFHSMPTSSAYPPATSQWSAGRSVAKPPTTGFGIMCRTMSASICCTPTCPSRRLPSN